MSWMSHKYSAAAARRFITSFNHGVSLDKVGVGMTVAGCLALVTDAMRQGQAPLNGSLPARDGNANGRVFTPEQCRQLEKDGYNVMDGFLSPQQVKDARQAIRKLDDDYQFRGSPYETFDGTSSTIRTRDRVIINKIGNHLDLVRQHIASFAKCLVDSDFQGFPGDAYLESTSTLHMPAQMQVSICDAVGGIDTRLQTVNNMKSDNEIENCNHRYDGIQKSTHNFYHEHKDSAGADNLGELGIIGWIKSQHLRQRYLTCILYLNTDWKEGDGGCLRVFPTGNSSDALKDGAPKHVDIAPLAGRMIVFSSPTLVHAVMATNVERYACVVWLALV
ncbi:2(OG)-Fe(II) oxygenase superfamily protein [Nitzschia inconspicua]|uniref:2(OG)-Fe(II) oxygenase superfamily protein n=1 Tax=Nitzschia inconspicua TaxID=303405 RepID=A0A9K3LUW0_9STRA|nr:2(OG)-Fe(II) oxygenase superfamily protein [Nitzschia inconspicua]